VLETTIPNKRKTRK